MIDEQLLRDAGWSEELIEAVKQATAPDETLQSNASTDATIELNESSVTESSSIFLHSLVEDEFSWPKLHQ